MAEINTSSGTKKVVYSSPTINSSEIKSSYTSSSGVSSLIGSISPDKKNPASSDKKTASLGEAGAKSAAFSGGLAAVSSIQNILNASSAYDSLVSQNRINAMELDRAEGILLQQGHQSMLDLKREGEENAISSQLALAAQGQNLNSAGAEKVSESYKAMGVQNALIEEINMMRGVYDIEFQRVEMRRAEDIAKAQKKNAIFSGIVTTAAAAAGGALGGTAGASAASAIASSGTSKNFS